MNNLNMVIPILMNFCTRLLLKSVSSQIGDLQAACHSTKSDIINDVKLEQYIMDILLQISNKMQSDVPLQ